ncbi:MAG: hypothetical protein ACRDLR_09510, partial [Gaiellaceae bacterium]
MHHDTHVGLGHDELQTLDNVLADTGASGHTRRWLLQRAGAGALAAGAVGAFGPVAQAFGASSRRSLGETPEVTLNTAVTAEVFANVFLAEAIGRAPGTPSGNEPLLTVLKAAGAAEYDHYAALTKLGAKPMTMQIWVPEALFGDGGNALFQNIEVAETLFVNAYLIGVTNFGNAGAADSARYAAEILGTEAEHRVLARTAQGLISGFPEVPNDFGFEQFIPHDLS